MTIRLLIADDQELVRTGFRVILNAEPDLEVVGEAKDGRDAIDAIRSLRPDVVLMDIRMPNLDGIEAHHRRPGGSPPSRARRASSSSRPSISTSTSTTPCVPERAASCSRTRLPTS